MYIKDSDLLLQKNRNLSCNTIILKHIDLIEFTVCKKNRNK